jgi:amino acid transporter
MIGGILFWPDN